MPSGRVSPVLTKGVSLPESDLRGSQAFERPAPCMTLGSHAAAKRVRVTREAAICSSDWYQTIRAQFPTESLCGNNLVLSGTRRRPLPRLSSVKGALALLFLCESQRHFNKG